MWSNLPFFLPQEGIRSYFGTPTWQTIGVFLAGVLTTVVVIRKMWKDWQEGGEQEKRVETMNRGWNRPAKENRKMRGKRKGFGVEMQRKRQIRELKMASTNRKRARERRRRKEWESSMMQMSRGTLVTPELVLFLIYNFKPW